MNYLYAGGVLLDSGAKHLDSTKIYEAQEATNIPHCERNGLIFVDGLLLNNTEYTIIKE